MLVACQYFHKAEEDRFAIPRKVKSQGGSLPAEAGYHCYNRVIRRLKDVVNCCDALADSELFQSLGGIVRSGSKYNVDRTK
jgi:hypothetical protein